MVLNAEHFWMSYTKDCDMHSNICHLKCTSEKTYREFRNGKDRLFIRSLNKNIAPQCRINHCETPTGFNEVRNLTHDRLTKHVLISMNSSIDHTSHNRIRVCVLVTFIAMIPHIVIEHIYMVCICRYNQRQSVTKVSLLYRVLK